VKVAKTWTAEKVRAAQKRFETAGGDPSDPSGPLGQWLALHELDEVERRYQTGNRQSWHLFAAIRLCAQHDLRLPDWAAAAFIDGYDRVLSFRAPSWDRAFGAPFAKGTSVTALRRRRQRAMAAYQSVNTMMAGGIPIDQAFLSVGRQLGISDSTVRDYYYFIRKRLGNSVTKIP
jgi:hypothetical protein